MAPTDRKLKLFQEQLVENCDPYFYESEEEYVDAVPDKKYWYDGCLQERFNEGNQGEYSNFTAPSFFMYRMEVLPPTVLQYPGWEKQQIIKNGFNKLTMPQFWVVCMKKPVPKQLQIDGWWEQKFVYDILHGMEWPTYDCGDYICLYGTMKDAYKYYGIVNTIDDMDQYKISDSGKCELCYCQGVPVYNFCRYKHQEGICVNCYKQLDVPKCPFCRKRLAKPCFGKKESTVELV